MTLSELEREQLTILAAPRALCRTDWCGGPGFRERGLAGLYDAPRTGGDRVVGFSRYGAQDDSRIWA